MQLESLIFIICWASLFFFAKTFRSNDFFGGFFLITQFVFIGVGILFWEGLESAAVTSFPTYNLTSFTEETVVKTNLVLFLGVFSAYTTYQLLYSYLHSTGDLPPLQDYPPPNNRLMFLFLGFGACCLYFIVSKLHLLTLALSIGGTDSLVALSEARKLSLNSYLVTLVIYNIFPAICFACFLNYLKQRTFKWKVILLSGIIIATLSLLLVFQKRPLIVFYIGLTLTYVFYSESHKFNSLSFNIFTALYRTRWYLFSFFVVLVGFYFFYTSHRFQNDFITALMINTESAIARTLGRLSIPALMYVQYFSVTGEYYGFTNVGLFSSFFGFEIFKDVEVVANEFSLIGDQGTLAASVFIDFFGAFGYFGVVIGGIAVGLALFGLECIRVVTRSRMGGVFVSTVSLIFIYYLSQASLFRSLLGYGGFFFLILWVILYKVDKTTAFFSSAHR